MQVESAAVPLGRREATLVEDDRAVGEARGQVEVVEDGEDGEAASRSQPLEQLDQRELMRDVEMGRRLVEEEEARLLGESEGDEDALPLPARQLVHPAIGELLHVRVNQGPGDRRLVIGRTGARRNARSRPPPAPGAPRGG